MLKKILIAFVVAIPFLASAQNVKIGLVNLEDVINALPEYADAQKQVKDASDKYEAEAKKLTDEMNAKMQEYQQLKDDALPATRQRMESELQDGSEKIQQFYQLAQQDIQRMNQELMQPILGKVNNAIQSVGQEGGYTLVMPLDPTLILYYSAAASDITEQVKAKLAQ